MGKSTFLHYRKRRYHCDSCDRHFTEPFSLLPKNCRLTTRLCFEAIHLLKSSLNVSNVASQLGISVSSIFRRLKDIKHQKPKTSKFLTPSAQKLLPPIKSQRRSLIEHRWQLFIHSLTVFSSYHILHTRHFPSGCRKLFHSDFLSSRLNAQRQAPVPWGVDNTLWALRASFEIRHLRRLREGQPTRVNIVAVSG